MGSQFTTVAMAWQMYELTDSPFQVGLIGLSRALPPMAMMLFGGLLADAFDRRRLLAFTQGGQLLASLSPAGDIRAGTRLATHPVHLHGGAGAIQCARDASASSHRAQPRPG